MNRPLPLNHEFSSSVASTQEHQPRTGLCPAGLHAQFTHRIDAALPIARPQYPLMPGQRIPTKLLPGATAILTVEALAEHPEHPECLTWRCRHAKCAAQTWPTEEDLVKAHPSNAVLRRAGEQHVYLAVLDVPESEDKTRPASVRLLTPEEI